MLRSGVCSWTDKSLIDCGRFYKGKKTDTASLLEFYSSKLPCVEVDASTYTIPTVNRVEKWVESSSKDFVFHFKAHQVFTHQTTEYQKLPRLIREDFAHPGGPMARDILLKEIPEAIQEQLFFLFNMALQAVADKGKMGVTVFQFPESFHCTAENMELIRRYRKWLQAEFVMAFEFRAKSWFFSADDLAALKEAGQGEPETTAEPTQRMQETMAFVSSMANCTLIAVDEYLKRDARPTAAVPHPTRLTPIWTQCIGDIFYVRVHRRVGSDRLLSESELQAWAERISALEPKPRRLYMMWNTNFETQSVDNAARLEKLLDPALVCDWKQVYLENKKADRGSIFSFFGASPKKPPAAAAAAAPGSKKRETTPPLPVDDEEPPQPAAPPPQKKKAKTAAAPKKKGGKNAGAVATALQAQSLQSFFKPKE